MFSFSYTKTSQELTSPLPLRNPKECAAYHSAQMVKQGNIVGLGTGSTASYFIGFLGERNKIESLDIQCIASSSSCENLARSYNLPLINPSSFTDIDITIDGADEIDPQGRMIKGGGGALLREKLLARSSKKYIIIVDESKQVTSLGKFGLPLEISPFGYQATIKRLENLGFLPQLRTTKEGHPFTTDQNNFIVDLGFQDNWPCAHDMNSLLLTTTGVLETGLFLSCLPTVIIGVTNSKSYIFS